MSASMDQTPAPDLDIYRKLVNYLQSCEWLGDLSEDEQIHLSEVLQKYMVKYRPTPTPAAQGAVENGVVLLKGLLPTVQNAVLEEMVRLILAHRPPAVQGEETREAVARHLCLLKTGRDGFTGWDLIHEVEKANWRGEADKILSLIHPQPGREEAK